MVAKSFRFLIVLLASVLFASIANAQFVTGRYAGEFMSLGAGARALSMGGAATASPLPSSAVYYNPSSLAGLTMRHVEFMHASQFDNLYTYDYLSFTRPLKNGCGGGITALYTRVSDIPLTRLSDPSQPLSDDNRVEVRKTTGDHELALLAGLGRSWGEWRSGATAKLLMKSVAEESAFGLGLDLGFGRSLTKKVEVGLAVRDVTTSVLAWSTGRTEGILPSLAVGGSFSTDLTAANARIVVAGELDTHLESRGEAELIDAGFATVDPKLGLEYEIARTVSLRGGFKGDEPTFGAGLRLSKLSLGAAFEDHGDLGFTHRISVGYGW